jgi:quaternary ammonium compound-resistance protein SugE
MKAWIYVFIAAIFQVLWGITLKKFLHFDVIWNYIKQGKILNPQFGLELIPLIAYFIIGLVIVYFISSAYKLIPMSVAYAVWMGLAMVIQTGVDIFFFKDSFNMFQLFFISLILMGVIGMRGNTKVTSHEIIIDEIDEMI